jgi:hypothetical protein
MSPIWQSVFRRCKVCNGNFPMIGFPMRSSRGAYAYAPRFEWVCRLCRRTRRDHIKSENRLRVKARDVIRREGRRLSNPERKGGPIIQASADLVNIYGWSVDRIERLLRHAFEGECIGCETAYAEMPNDLSNLTVDIKDPHAPPWLETNVQPLCATCNMTKQQLSGQEWGEYLYYVRLWKEQRALLEGDPWAAGVLFAVA